MKKQKRILLWGGRSEARITYQILMEKEFLYLNELCLFLPLFRQRQGVLLKKQNKMNTNKSNQDIADNSLIEQAKSGDKKALEDLIIKYQDWVFNVALAFVADRDEAFDITQEVLIKIITHLSTFKQESSFKTWLYRIVKNHFLNMKRSKYEATTTSFEDFGNGLDSIPNEKLSDYKYEVEEKILVKEAKISCMRGMLLCLDREQRMIYILGELFEFPNSVSSEIMEISNENFRVKLHRAKQQLYSFMNDKCGLINQKNPCRCVKKTAGFIKMGFVDPVKLHFQKDQISNIDKMLEHKIDVFDNEVMSGYQGLYQEMPFQKSPDTLENIKVFLSSEPIRKTFNFE